MGAHAVSASSVARVGAGFDACEPAELGVGEPAGELREALAVAALVEPAGDEPADDVVEQVGADAPEDRAADAGVAAEATAQVDLVRLVPGAALVANGAALEADVADPVLRAGVRAAVEMELELGDVVPEAALEPLDQACEPRLRLGDGEVAVRLARAADRAGADRVDVGREADLREPRVHVTDGVLLDPVSGRGSAGV